MVVGAQLMGAQVVLFSHIIIVVQENRTPDNLFYGAVPAGILGSNYDLQAPPAVKSKLKTFSLAETPDCYACNFSRGSERQVFDPLSERLRRLRCYCVLAACC
jgi:hypothetical protein